MRCASLLLLSALLVPGSAAQQRPAAEGIARLTDWPASSEAARAELGERDVEVLPFLDTLALGYRYLATERGPRLEAALEWAPGRRGIYDGREVDYERLPTDVEMTALVLGAQVYAGGRPVASAVIELDSLALAASPATHPFTVDTLTWETVFEGASAAQAQAYFEDGFELRDLEIVSVAFASYEDVYGGEVAERERPRRRRRATRRTVYEPGIGTDIYIGGVFGGGSRPRPPRDGRRRDMGRDAAEQDRADRTRTRTDRDREEGAAGSGPRGDRTTTRTSAEGGDDAAQEGGESTSKDGERATSEREGRKIPVPKRDDDDDDDDNDNNELLPAAIAAAAAVGVAAYAGGTVGYYGNLAKAPIGLTSGFVRPGGGALLHVAVNEAFLLSDPGPVPRHLVAKLTGFYDAFDAPVQPAVGIGVLARDPGEDVDVQPSLSFGAVATLGPVVLMGAYDVAQGGTEIGLAINFRHKRPGEDQVAARK